MIVWTNQTHQSWSEPGQKHQTKLAWTNKIHQQTQRTKTVRTHQTKPGGQHQLHKSLIVTVETVHTWQVT